MLLNADMTAFLADFFERTKEPFALPWIDAKVNEARSVVRKRSKTQRETFRRLALWLVDGAPDHKTDEPQIDFGANADGTKPQSPAMRLRHCQVQLNDVPATDKPFSPSWDELYAVLSLDLFLNAYVAGGFGRAIPHDYGDESLFPLSLYVEPLTCAAQAVEALAYRRLVEKLAFELSKQKSINASNAGLARHQKLLPVKRAVAKLYFSKYHQLSNRQAARKIIEYLQESNDLSLATTTKAGRDISIVKFLDIEILKAEDVDVRFEKWIADIKKGSIKKSV